MAQSSPTLRDYARSLWWRLALTAAFIYIVVEGPANTVFWAISIGLFAMWGHDLWKFTRARRARTAAGGS